MGAFTLVMFVIRFFVFKLHESPKFLMSRGKDAEAVKSIHAVARYNKVISTLTVEHLTRIDAEADRSANTKTPGYATIGAAVGRNLKRFDLEHIRSLFVTPRLAFSTSLVIVLWGLIGLACKDYCTEAMYWTNDIKIRYTIPFSHTSLRPVAPRLMTGHHPPHSATTSSSPSAASQAPSSPASPSSSPSSVAKAP